MAGRKHWPFTDPKQTSLLQTVDLRTMSATRDVAPSSSSTSNSNSGSDLYGRLDAAGKIVSERLSQDDKMATVDLDSMQNGGAGKSS